LNWVSQDPAYHALKRHVIESTGLAFYADRDELLAELIGERLSELKFSHCSAYDTFLANGQAGRAEMDVLIARLTIGETYFFRDRNQFAAIRDVILPDIMERKKKTRELRIWSAGCATGAEPYSLAILLADEMADRMAGWQISIYATDLNREYLAQAAQGKYREWSLRATLDEERRRCFTQEGHLWAIHPRYKQWIEFRQMNLIASQPPTALLAHAPFDLILCRNVMIYFSPEAISAVIGRFHESLADGGWLVVGACEYNSESYRAFHTVEATRARLYQRIPASIQAVRTTSETPPAPQPPKATVHRAFQTVEAVGARLDRKMSAAVPQAAVPPAREDVAGLRQLADRGDWQGAAAYGQRLLASNRLNPNFYFYQALIFENLEKPDESERSLRRAIYLDRNFALAHYHLGVALKRNQRVSEAARAFGNVVRVLAGMPVEAMVPGGSGLTVTELKELTKTQLRQEQPQ
jgi:chemotaxis protein methyltransferase CheR